MCNISTYLYTVHIKCVCMYHIIVEFISEHCCTPVVMFILP